jgi:hypothetical protein
MVDNSTNITKTKESLSSDGQHFLQYQHTKRKFKQWWSTIPPISNKQRNSNNDGRQFKHNQQNKRKFRQGCQHFHQYEQNTIKFKEWWSTILPISTKQRKFKRWWSTIPPISTKLRKLKEWWSRIPPILTNQKKVYTVMVYNSTNINKPRESLHSDGLQFHQYQQKERKFKQWSSTIPPISTTQKEF